MVEMLSLKYNCYVVVVVVIVLGKSYTIQRRRKTERSAAANSLMFNGKHVLTKVYTIIEQISKNFGALLLGKGSELIQFLSGLYSWFDQILQSASESNQLIVIRN